MPNIRVSVEAARGCGFRKPGGLYLVSGELTRPCGKLPIPLHVCPTCGGGIKATRAWQWIKPRLLFSEAVCRDEVRMKEENAQHYRQYPSRAERINVHCGGCIVGGAMPERGGLLWIGGAYYKTPEEFMREARAQGVSRRIPTVPKGCKPGETVVYLAHREVPFWTLKDGDGNDVKLAIPQNMPAVFSAFVPRAIEYVVKGTETEEELVRLEKRGIELVDVKPQQMEIDEVLP